MRELDELESNNTKRIVFGLVGLVAIAVGIGLLFRSKGVGVAEEDHRILIIEDRTVGFEHYTADLGFEAISGDFEAWQDELAEQDGSRSAGEFGLADMLEFADERGYGYVVIENPQRFADEIGELELDEDGATSIGESEFAVLSVGDFAGPHQLGVDPSAPSIELDVGRRLLRTMFAHPRLGQTLEAGAAPSEIQAARLKLDKAITEIEQIAKHEARAAEVLKKLEDELGSFTSQQGAAPAARVLHEPLAGATAWALQDGRIVLQSDRLSFTLDTSGLGLRSSSDFSLHAIPAGAAASADAAVACPELLGGGRGEYSTLGMELSAERDAFFVVMRGNMGMLFAFDAAAGPCGLREVGKLPLPSSDNSFTAVNRRGIAMRHVDEAGQLHIDVQLLGESPVSVILDAPGFDSSSSLVWLDERRLANLVDLVGGRPALVIIDLDHTDIPVVLPLLPPQVEGTVWGHELARLPGSDPALVLRWSTDNRYTLSRLDFDRPWPELFGDEVPLPEIIAWTQIVEIGSHMRGFEIDPAGKAVAFTYESDIGVDVAHAAIPAEGGEAGLHTVILHDAYEHRDVAFRPAHDELLFRTRLRIENPEAGLLSVHAISVTPPK